MVLESKLQEHINTPTSNFPKAIPVTGWQPDCGLQVQGCFKATETVRTTRYREPRTSTSTFTQLLSSVACKRSV